MQKGCSFSGHRIIKREHERALPALITRAIGYAYENGCRDFFSGGAIGFDTLAAREVLRFRLSHPDVRLVLLLPCINQDEKWSEECRDAYQFLIREANEVIYTADEYTSGCIKKRNRKLAESCSMLIAYLYRRDSGTGQTVAMAKKLDKEVYNLAAAIDKM